MMHPQQHNFGSIFSKADKSLKQVSQTTKRADAAISEAQGAIRQGRETLTTVQRSAEDIESYIKRIKHIPIEELARRFDYKTKIAIEEIISLSSFMKKALLYLGAMATISIYLNILTKRL